jgi:hypothetical protein
VQEGLPLFAGKRSVGIGENEPDRTEEVGFAGTVATDEEVESRAER